MARGNRDAFRRGLAVAGAVVASAVPIPSATAHGTDGPHRRRFIEYRSSQLVSLLTNGKQEI
jgi:hypothetical protein